MATPIMQQVNALKAELAAKQDLAEWLEDTWSDLIETEHMASHLMNHVEDMFDRKRGKVDHLGSVVLTFRQESIELTEWTAGRVWAGLAALDKRMTERLNAITAAENAASDPRPLKIKQHAIDDGRMIDLIDELRNALDRMEGLDALVKQLPKGHRSAVERVTGDIHDLVTDVHNALNTVREKAAAP